MANTLKIVITGHVDHGKSTLIGRLLLDTRSLSRERMAELERISRELGKDAELAYFIDQLKEEREQERTIDTTQTFFHTKKRDFVIIDTPGHTEFLKNMMTGASLAEAAVLITDLREGIMEQTKRHAYLISMLGMNKVIAVLNKIDLVGFDENAYEKTRLLVSKIFDSIGIKPLHMIPVSAKEGMNISARSKETPWYKGPSLIEALESIRLEDLRSSKPLRMAVQDVYNMKGRKVAVGMISSGKLRSGQTVVLAPEGKKSKIVSIERFGEIRNEAVEGENIGLVLDGYDNVRRGDIISEVNAAATPTNEIAGELFWMSQEPLVPGRELTLKCSTQETQCTAVKITGRMDTSTLEILEDTASELKMNEAGQVTFKTARPVVVEDTAYVEDLGRFVIEKDNEMLGAGIIRKAASRRN